MHTKQVIAYLLGAAMVGGSLFGAATVVGGQPSVQVQQTEAIDPIPLAPVAEAVIAAAETPAYEPGEYEDEDEHEEEEDNDHY